ncbi:hypothetical protein TNCV_1385731 [Trichonephila clavipes]|nr:hypothetical protein TNCV_1385731 [Trichonephila clavipes]
MHRDENLPWRVPNLGNGLWKPMWNARIRTLWPMGCPLTSSSIYKGKPVPIELSIATIPSDGSDPQVMGITVNHAGLTSTPHEMRSTNINVFVSYTPRYPSPWNTYPFA